MTTWDKSPQLEAQVQASMGIVCELGMVGPFCNESCTTNRWHSIASMFLQDL